MAEYDQSGLRCKSVDWIWNGGDVTVVVPDGWMVALVILNVQTAFDGTGTVSVGYTAVPTAFITATAALGYYRSNELAGSKSEGYKMGASEDVLIDIFPGTASTGAGEVYVLLAPIVA